MSKIKRNIDWIYFWRRFAAWTDVYLVAIKVLVLTAAFVALVIYIGGAR